MTLTKKQRSVMVTVMLACAAVCLLGLLCWVIVTVMDQPATADPNIPTVNAQRYEKINLGNSDGTVDHFCLGTTGIWYGPNSGDFAVEAGDPQCR